MTYFGRQAQSKMTVSRPFRNESRDKTAAQRQNEGRCVGFRLNLSEIGSNCVRSRFEEQLRGPKNSSEGRAR